VGQELGVVGRQRVAPVMDAGSGIEHTFADAAFAGAALLSGAMGAAARGESYGELGHFGKG
jgi:hypothetical protein